MPPENVLDELERRLRYPLDEDGLADELIRQHWEEWRYTDEFGEWSRWSGNRWKPERTLAMYDLARKLCKESAENQPEDTKHAAIAPLRKAATVAAIERLARSDRRVASTVAQWDSHPMMLNTPTGTVDLEIGELRPHDPADMLTKKTRGAIRNMPWQALAPRWGRFLEELTDRDDDLRYYLQRLAGYAATGVVREHVLPFFYGPGGNGKGTWVETVAWALGDYARAMPEGFLEARQGDAHPTELADLQGVRFAYASETQAGSAWNESRLKALTGGDTIKARKMRQDFYEFAASHTLTVMGNNRPKISSVDQAIRRRLHLVPLLSEPKKMDRDLPETLRKEQDGVLMWIVEGTKMWLEEGLAPPKCVLEASEDYFDSQDPIGEWIEQNCHVGERWSSPITPLLKDYQRWCEDNGVRAVGRSRLGEELDKRKFYRQRDGKARRHLGIATKN